MGQRDKWSKIVSVLPTDSGRLAPMEKARYKWQPGRRQEPLLDTDKPRITLHTDLGCIDGSNKCLNQNNIAY